MGKSQGPPVQRVWTRGSGTLILEMQSKWLVASTARILDGLRFFNRKLKVRIVPADELQDEVTSRMLDALSSSVTVDALSSSVTNNVAQNIVECTTRDNLMIPPVWTTDTAGKLTRVAANRLTRS